MPARAAPETAIPEGVIGLGTTRSDDAPGAMTEGGFRPRSLDTLNALLVDVNGAIRPYLNVYLYVQRDWGDGAVGLVGTVSGLAALALQTPIGAGIDAVRDKRLVILAALVGLSLGTVVVAISAQFWPVLVAACVLATVGGVLSPAVAALTLGLVPRRVLARRMGRNAAFERAGNVGIALLIGAVGWLFPDRAVFLLVPALAVSAAAALFSIPRSAIDPVRARGQEPGARKPNAQESNAQELGAARDGRAAGAPAGLRALLRNRPLLIFCACVTLFHFANGPLLTLVAQEIGQAHPEWSSVIVSVCIVGAQAVMVPMAILVGRRADAWGRKPLLVLGFAVLPLRALLYLASHDPVWLIAVQCLDGIGAGLLSAAKPLVLADLMRGSGRYNLAHGLVGTLQGAGASLAFVVAGTLAQGTGFWAAYLLLAGVALAALAVLVFLMPETRDREDA